MENARTQKAGTSAMNKRHSTTGKFSGTDNPRELRAIHALMRRPMPREHLDREVGCSNGPDLISNLRAKGLEIPCTRVPDLDRDGLPIRRGVYSLVPSDARKLNVWLSSRQKGFISPDLAMLLAFAVTILIRWFPQGAATI